MKMQPLSMLSLALVLCCANLACQPIGSPREAELPRSTSPHTLVGAGATFPAPLYQKWIEEYRQVRPEVQIMYRDVGSGEGIESFVSGVVDFGASDAAMSDEDMAKVQRGVQLLPVTAGSIVLAYHLPGVTGDLKLRRAVYVDIFLGRITKWNDARIQQDNPGLQLPNLTINIAARQDSSGTTFAFTNHLSAISDQWRDHGPGTGKVIDWPGNTLLARGNEGVAGLVKRSAGMIGYVEYGVAERAGLQMAWLENKASHFVQPTANSGQATLANAQLPDKLRAFFPDPEGLDSYPIVTFSWLLLYRNYPADRAAQLQAFLRWCLTDGQQHSAALGYLPLSSHVAQRSLQALDEID